MPTSSSAWRHWEPAAGASLLTVESCLHRLHKLTEARPRSFSATAERVAATVVAAAPAALRLELQEFTIPASRLNLCLFPLRLYSPAAVAAAATALADPAVGGQVSAALGSATRLEFGPQLRAYGPCKVAAVPTRACADAVGAATCILREAVTARLSAASLSPEEAEVLPGVAPHVSLLKLTWPFGDKKAKAAVNKLAGQTQLHRVELPAFERHAGGGEGAAGGGDGGKSATAAGEGAKKTGGADEGLLAVSAVIELLAIDGPHPAPTEPYYVSHSKVL